MFTGGLFCCFALIGFLKASCAESTSFGENDYCTKEDLINVRLTVSNLSDKILEQKSEILEQKDGILEQKREIIEQKNEILEQKNEIFEMKSSLSGHIMEETDMVAFIQEIKEQLSTQNETLFRQAGEIDDLMRGLMSLQQQFNNSHENTSFCQNGSITFQQSCYKFYDEENLTWIDSIDFCAARGSSLVIFETMAEYNFLVAYIKAFSKKDDYWIAATDSDKEGDWLWAPNGSPAGILPWANDQPNSYNGEQDCVEINGGLLFRLNDDKCSATEHPLCEMKMN